MILIRSWVHLDVGETTVSPTQARDGRGAGKNHGMNTAGLSTLLNTARRTAECMKIAEGTAAWRRERRVVSRAARRLEQAERERSWALASIRTCPATGPTPFLLQSRGVTAPRR